MTGGTKRCIVVSTLSEAEFFADGGYDDITYGFPITPDKLPQAAKLMERLQKFHVFVDNDVILKALVNVSLPKGKKWSVFLKVDCGYRRGKIAIHGSDCPIPVGELYHYLTGEWATRMVVKPPYYTM
jgi:D-serine deaminase-like pyridoxal phosphate-dependent protein